MYFTDLLIHILFCLEERLLDIEVPSKRFNNLTKEESEVLYTLKDDPSIIIKGADGESAVFVWGREDCLKEAYRQLEDKEVYEQVPNNTSMKALEKYNCGGTCRKIDVPGRQVTSNCDYYTTARLESQLLQ